LELVGLVSGRVLTFRRRRRQKDDDDDDDDDNDDDFTSTALFLHGSSSPATVKTVKLTYNPRWPFGWFSL